MPLKLMKYVSPLDMKGYIYNFSKYPHIQGGNVVAETQLYMHICQKDSFFALNLKIVFAISAANDKNNISINLFYNISLL